ncbi:hypothetical protein C3007_02935 [Avibacterium gallinarum]|uniref:Protein of uncharacterized function (DUF3298) n=1 Tax=Avibacterium gallinarum TaxID=755 RepID=A0A379AWW1_AVIGA|nr:DUF3298 and DUF4163 domain-containing protein [Avibacterium gallinarum]POY44893.1 hypothetical protein C3007_02935 [Avibacterium gallinarum]TDP30055.1 uncharacterized protein DUF3298 [Avibacterium gallinarum]SUB26554.1 Protein of uncharacterised function (DUF3298) [Avibacterium gallinarum]
MNKTVLALSFSAIFLLSACDDKQVAELQQKLQQAEKMQQSQQQEINQLQNELNAQKSLFPALQVEIFPLFQKEETLTLKNTDSTATIKVSVSMPETHIEWLDELLRQYWGRYTQNEKADGEQKPSRMTKEQLRQGIEQIYKDYHEESLTVGTIGKEFSISPYYLGQRQNWVGFRVDNYTYEGGAHGLGWTDYLNIDVQQKTLITLEKVVSQENQPTLRNVLWKVYTQNLEQGEEPFTSLEDFYISPEFYFDQEGIHFVYPPYALNSYAEGKRTLDLYWGQTEIDLLNPEYVKPWLK